MLRTTLLVSLSLFVIPACHKKDEPTGASPSASPTEPGAAPAKLAYQKLGSLPLEAEIPSDANVDDSTKSAGFPSVTVYAQPTTFIFGPGDMSDVKPTIEETKDRVAKEVDAFKGFTREDKTADGWILEGAGESMIDKKPLYTVSVRRTIAGVPYDCGTNADTKDEIARAEKLCQSLRAAK